MLPVYSLLIYTTSFFLNQSLQLNIVSLWIKKFYTENPAKMLLSTLCIQSQMIELTSSGTSSCGQWPVMFRKKNQFKTKPNASYDSIKNRTDI